MDGPASHQLLPPSAQSNAWAAHDHPPTSTTMPCGNRPTSLRPAGLTHGQFQQQLWSKANSGLTQQHSSQSFEQEADTQAFLGAGLQPPVDPELHHRPQSCILPHVNRATTHQTQTSQEDSLKNTTADVNIQSRQLNGSKSVVGKPPAIAPVCHTNRMISAPGNCGGSDNQPNRTAEHRSAPCTYPTFANGPGTSAGGHLPFSRHSRGQPWARCNSAPAPVPPAPLSFCWQQGHLPDIYQNMSVSPSRLKAQAHRGGQGAKSCLAW